MGRVHTVTRRVEFRDTDAAGIAHYSTFFTAFEAAEHDFLRSLGLSVKLTLEDGTYSFPRVQASCQYRRPLVFEQPYAIEVAVTRLGRSSVTYAGTFREVDPESGQPSRAAPLAEASVTAVCVRLGEGGPLAAVELPGQFRRALAPYLVSTRGDDSALERRQPSPARRAPGKPAGDRASDSALDAGPPIGDPSSLSYLWENTPDPTEGAGG